MLITVYDTCRGALGTACGLLQQFRGGRMITNPRIVSPSYSPASSTGAAPLAVGLEDEAQRPGVGQGRAKQELAAGAQRRRLASGELASADRGAEGAA